MKGTGKPQRRPVGRPPNPAGRKYPKGHPRYQPTKAELEEPIVVDATFEQLMDALLDVPRDQRTPGRGERLLATIR